jgi:hypothetical protein
MKNDLIRHSLVWVIICDPIYFEYSSWKLKLKLTTQKITKRSH